MTKAQKDNLFLLIKSLTKSEKRQFKLYVGRLDVNSDSKFLNLFNFLDKSAKYDESAILKTGIVKKQQLIMELNCFSLIHFCQILEGHFHSCSVYPWPCCLRFSKFYLPYVQYFVPARSKKILIKSDECDRIDKHLF